MVSVVIPCYNDAAFLERALISLSTQTRQPHQVIVVDNNSTDTTSAVAGAFAGVELLYEHKQGILPATTTGYNAATGDVIVRIDADTHPSESFIADITHMWERIFSYNQYAPKKVVAAIGNAKFDNPGLLGRVASRAYMGAYYATTRSALGHYPLFGTNFSMITSWWQDIRASVDTTVQEVHDDLHLSFALRPDETVWFQQDLCVRMDGRALVGWNQLARRFWRGVRTVGINFRHQAPPIRLSQRGLLPGASTRLDSGNWEMNDDG